MARHVFITSLIQKGWVLVFLIFPSWSHTVWFLYFSINSWWTTEESPTQTKHWMDMTSGALSIWMLMKTAVCIGGKKISRNKYLFHMLNIRYDWQCNLRVLQGWLSRPSQECNVALGLFCNIRSVEVVGISIALLYWWLNFWKSSIIFAYIRKRNGLRREVLVCVSTIESFRLPRLK